MKKVVIGLIIFILILLAIRATYHSFEVNIEIKAEETPLLKRFYKQPAREVGTRTITAYTLGRSEENDSDPCIGAYQDDLCELAEVGIQICATREFKRGTLLQFGDTECVVLDKTAKKYQNRVDVAMTEYHLAKQFGIIRAPVSIIGSASIQTYGK